MRASLLVVSFALALAACGDDEAPPSAEHSRGPYGAVASAPQATVARPHHALGTLDRESLRPAPLGAAPTTADGEEATTATAAATGATEQERDLGAELASAVGSPASCIDLATARALHGALAIHVTATITPTGSVTRGTASAVGLPEAAAECIRARVLAAHLGAPVEGAPRTIATTLSFDVTATDDETTTETPVWHQPGAVAEPGVVLPAVGATGRPEGAVAPDHTLPAQATGRPEGSVAPDLVLPARGPS
ncbi:MAG: hypothetical protein U0234_04910 [Sandaracinus sp.]